MSVEQETRTVGFWWWKKEQNRYKIEISVYDRYDFTEWRTDGSFGSIMNNAAYIGQIYGLIHDYDWEVSFNHYTKWSD